MKTELLAPAGDMERLRMAVAYGADAVYLAGQDFGMRAFAGNFSPEDLRAAVDFCHSRGVHVHVTCNTMPRNDEVARLPQWLELLDDAGVDAAIMADLGVFSLAKRYAPHLKRHVSTQAGVTNYEVARAWHDLGAHRVILARELSLDEVAELRAKTPKELEIEAFVHGAMCVSYSGRCLLSNYMTGRDAQRGACAQPCRYKYALMEEKRPGEYFPVFEENGETFIMNSRDMCMMEHLPRLMESGVRCFKIEGRMKNELYIGTVVGAYRRAMDAYAADPAAYQADEALRRQLRGELDRISHRVYDTGFYFGQPEVCGEAVGTQQAAEYMGYVVDVSGGDALVEMKNRFFVGDRLETVTPKGSEPLVIEDIVLDATGEHVGVVNVPNTLVRIPCGEKLGKGDMLRGPVRNRA